ncbi:MAG: hypothetical protein AAF757_26250 [Cyanobacteria bacterium P01_D01_bin.116]
MQEITSIVGDEMGSNKNEDKPNLLEVLLGYLGHIINRIRRGESNNDSK